jgi:acetyl-CoA C-acetyltransferase
VFAGPNPQKDPHNDFLSWKPSRWAAEVAYDQAGITQPAKQLHVAQVHDCFTLTELITYEDLALCEKGAAREHIAAGSFELSGFLPVNTDGGLKSFGHPTGATGVRMIYENTLQLQGRADKRQVKNATLALSHNIGGHPTACGIAILGVE